MRRFLVGLCLALAALLAVLTPLTHWSRDELLDTKTFVATTQEIVDSQQVQNAIAQEITDATFAQPEVQKALDEGVAELLPPKLQPFKDTIIGGIRSGVSALIDKVVASKAFEKVIVQTATIMHTRLVTGQGLQFDLGDVKKLLKVNANSGLVGKAASLIPNDIASVKLLTDDQQRLLNTVIDIVNGLWVGMFFGAIIFFAVAVGLSRHRRKTLRTFGVLLVVFMGLCIAVLSWARSPVLAGVSDVARPVATIVWDETIPALIKRQWYWLILGAVLVLVTSLWGRLGLIDALRRAWGSTRAKASELTAAAGAKVADAKAGGGEAAPADLRFRDRVRIFVEALDLRTKMTRLAEALGPRLGVWRGCGIGLAAVVMLLWPGKTLGMFVGIIALLVLYLGALEVIMGFAPEGGGAPALAGAGGAPVPVATATPPAPADTPPPAAEAPDDVALQDRIAMLQQLGQVKDSGLLSEEELEAEKRRLLDT